MFAMSRATPLPEGEYTVGISGLNSGSVALQILDGPYKGQTVYVGRGRLKFTATVKHVVNDNVTYEAVFLQDTMI